jgi:hypothetical protein
MPSAPVCQIRGTPQLKKRLRSQTGGSHQGSQSHADFPDRRPQSRRKIPRTASALARRGLVVISDRGDNHRRYGLTAVPRYLLGVGVEVCAVNIMADFPQPTWTVDGPLKFEREPLRRHSLGIVDALRSATQLPLLRVSNSFTTNLQIGAVLNLRNG